MAQINQAGKLSESDIRELREIADGVPPAGMPSEKRRAVLKRMGLAYREDAHPWKWHLTETGQSALGQPLR